MNKELSNFKRKMRQLIADYMWSEGCSCCRSDKHAENEQALGKALNIPKYPDKSGYDFLKYRTGREE